MATANIDFLKLRFSPKATVKAFMNQAAKSINVAKKTEIYF